MLFSKRIFLLAFLLAFSASGAFFWKLTGAAEKFLSGLGGERMYATPVTVNGLDGELLVYTFPSGDAGALAKALAADPPSGTRCFLIPATTAPLVLAVTGKAAAARGTPQWPAAIPQFAARPLFSAETRASNLSFLTGASDAPPAETSLQAETSLSLAGFSEASPPGASCRIFAKGPSTALLFVSPSPDGTHVTVLVRKGAGKF